MMRASVWMMQSSCGGQGLVWGLTPASAVAPAASFKCCAKDTCPCFVACEVAGAGCGATPSATAADGTSAGRGPLSLEVSALETEALAPSAAAPRALGKQDPEKGARALLSAGVCAAADFTGAAASLSAADVLALVLPTAACLVFCLTAALRKAAGPVAS